MRPTDIRLPGAVDLSALKRPAAAAPTATPPSAGGSGTAAGGAVSGLVIDVTEATFEAEVIRRSSQVPVVIDFWAEWCGPCKQLSPVLERLVADAAGRWVLAKIDVDAEQRLASAFQIQSIPSVLAVIAGQPVPLFQGAMPEEQVRQVLDEVLRVAAANGVTGMVAVDATGLAGASDDAGAGAAGDGASDVGVPLDPDLAAAYDSLDRGDVEGALTGFRSLLQRRPGDVDGRLGLARAELIGRVAGLDEAAIRMRAESDPTDLDAVTALSDFDVLDDRVDHAIDRLVSGIRTNTGAERDRLRGHLVALFDVLDPEDPRLVAGRRALANALF
jgi:putative thioredoxin